MVARGSSWVWALEPAGAGLLGDAPCRSAGWHLWIVAARRAGNRNRGGGVQSQHRTVFSVDCVGLHFRFISRWRPGLPEHHPRPGPPTPS